MDNPGTLSKLEQLHLFLDGELDPHEEEGLFNAVASDPEIRSELRDAMTMRRAFHSDAVRILPGDALKMSLLAAIDSEFGPATPPTVGRAWSFRTSALKYVLVPALTGIVGLYLGARLFGVTDSPSGSLSNTESSSSFAIGIASARVLNGPALAAGSPPPATVAPAPMRVPTPIGNPVAVVNQERSTLSPGHNRNQTTHSAGDRAAISTSLVSVPRSPSVEPVPMLLGDDVALTDVSRPDGAPRVDSLNATESTPLYPAVDSSRPLGVSLHVRNFSALAYPTTVLPSNASPLFDNASFGVLYAVSDHGRAGVEIGQEAFPQIFETTLDGQKVRVEQNPHTWWIAGTYRLLGDRTGILLDGAPLVEASAGASGLGAIVRGGIGIDLAPEERWSFIISLHGSLLAYRSNQTTYVSRKVGLLYGASVRF